MKANGGLCMLTTTDNPYDPSTDWDRWFQFDETKGHCTCGLIARIAKVSDSMPEIEKEEEIERAIDFIIANDLENIYVKKVYANNGTDSK